MQSMENNIRIFMDTNILLDYLLFRGEEALATEYLINCFNGKNIEFFIAAHSLTNIYYILRKKGVIPERDQILLNLCAMCNVHEISAELIKRSIMTPYADDLKDSLQIHCAVDDKCDYFITRDLQLFNNNPVKTLLPHELIKELSL